MIIDIIMLVIRYNLTGIFSMQLNFVNILERIMIRDYVCVTSRHLLALSNRIVSSIYYVYCFCYRERKESWVENEKK